MKKVIKAVAIQMDIEPLQAEINIAKALAFMEMAIEEHGNIDLFVLPEDCITGPVPYHLKDYCLTNDSPEITTFQEFAKRHSTHIVLGSFIKKIDDHYYNTTLVIDDTGSIVLEHHKTKLSWVERSYLTPGKQLRPVETNIGTIGILNCWELADPLIGRTLVQQGADILCCPSYWSYGDLPASLAKINSQFDIDFMNTIVPSRSWEYGALVIFANVAGEAKVQVKTKQYKCLGAGQSQICVPGIGRVAHISEPDIEGYLYYPFDREIAKTFEDMTSLRSDIIQSKQP